jgi:hypothetical protein
MSNFNVIDILAKQLEGHRAILTFCQLLSLIRSDDNGPICDNCGTRMLFGTDSSVADGHIWRCNGYVRKRKQSAVRCNRKTSVRVGTIFEGIFN